MVWSISGRDLSKQNGGKPSADGWPKLGSREQRRIVHRMGGTLGMDWARMSAGGARFGVIGSGMVGKPPGSIWRARSRSRGRKIADATESGLAMVGPGDDPRGGCWAVWLHTSTAPHRTAPHSTAMHLASVSCRVGLDSPHEIRERARIARSSFFLGSFSSLYAVTVPGGWSCPGKRR